ncbi:Asp-tRNA(Asn)/Glu-tRNA(Gln) amidotransferase GatCAB subunit B [Candidatus Pacearchaeota archaeon CG10_big_fil_rev_8_21_14_0_10_32_14]|nr:MAG: Asp-tRNA(Asn)/Glu-tRNA(Gln) amidotransferase GatCAB subunit B [Candidatus Pacearchaeota archaeon CG10_big_fil_rev_8_21_14_0_10_32_14]
MPKIGLEIHGYLQTNEKLFCNCKAIHGAKVTSPNTNVCPICTAQPGAKPMLPNSVASKKIIQIALVLNCKINEKLIWQRKHYSWPDLPKGYQNTISGTYAIPVGTKGKFNEIGITEVHIEEDPAAWNPKTGEVDYNRSGFPLVEIVTDPDFSSSDQVVEWLKNLLHALSYIKAIDKSLGIKADVNVSLPDKKGERVELKNINSIENIKNAIEVEIQRQISQGVPKIQETRAYNAEKQTTSLMRTKEQASDYRFIPEPDLPLVKISKNKIKVLEKEIPQSPQVKLKNIIKDYKIDNASAEILTKNIDVIQFFEEVIKKIPKEIAVPWTTIELLRILNYNKVSLDDPTIDIKPEHFIELLKLVENKSITPLKAKEILNKFVPVSFSPEDEAKSQGKITNEKELEEFCKISIKNNPKATQDFKNSEQNSLNFLIGDVMKQSNKRADYQKTREILIKELKK